MTDEQIDVLIEQLRQASREIKDARKQLAYLHGLQKYEKLLREKYAATDRVPS